MINQIKVKLEVEEIKERPGSYTLTNEDGKIVNLSKSLVEKISKPKIYFNSKGIQWLRENKIKWKDVI